MLLIYSLCLSWGHQLSGTAFSSVPATSLVIYKGLPFRSHRLEVPSCLSTWSIKTLLVSFERIQALEYYSRRAICHGVPPSKWTYIVNFIWRQFSQYTFRGATPVLVNADFVILKDITSFELRASSHLFVLSGYDKHVRFTPVYNGHCTSPSLNAPRGHGNSSVTWNKETSLVNLH